MEYPPGIRSETDYYLSPEEGVFRCIKCGEKLISYCAPHEAACTCYDQSVTLREMLTPVKGQRIATALFFVVVLIGIAWLAGCVPDRPRQLTKEDIYGMVCEWGDDVPGRTVSSKPNGSGTTTDPCGTSTRASRARAHLATGS